LNINVVKEGSTTGSVNDAAVGGIVGNTTTVTRSHVAIDSATVTANITHKHAAGRIYLGGIAGHFQATVTLNDLEFIYGTIRGEHDLGVSYIGGLFGRIDTPIVKYSYASGNIESHKEVSGNVNIGGLFGEIRSTSVNNCHYELGSIRATGNDPLFIGGIAGQTEGAGALYYNLSNFTECHSHASLIEGIRTDDTVHAGGFIGYSVGADYIKCYAKSEVRAEGGFHVNAGGFVGRFYYNWENKASFDSCYAAGNVQA
jgi:hypothetical protein